MVEQPTRGTAIAVVKRMDITNGEMQKAGHQQRMHALLFCPLYLLAQRIKLGFQLLKVRRLVDDVAIPAGNVNVVALPQLARPILLVVNCATGNAVDLLNIGARQRRVAHGDDMLHQPPVAHDHAFIFNFSKVQLGAVLGYFGFGYLFGSLCGGFLADRLGTKKVWLMAGVLWSVLEIATAWPGDLGMALFGGSAIMGFAALRILFGFSEGPAYALMNKAIAHWAPDKERGFALSIGLLSTQVGSLLTATIAVGLLLTNDWRMMFILLGAFSLLAMLLFARTFSDAPDLHPAANAAERALIRDGQQQEASGPYRPKR